MFDYIIVGGGINGLQIAALLVHRGSKVAVFEKNSRLGGRAFVLERDGFKIDNGLHLIRFGPESAIASTFRKMGHKVKFLNLGTSYLYRSGKRYIFPTGPSDFINTRMLSVSEKLKGVPLLVSLRKIKDQWIDILHVPVEKWLDAREIKSGLRTYFELVASSMLVCPFMDKASTGELLFNMGKVLKSGKSVMYPLGGWKPLLDFLVNKIRENGEVATSTKVNSVGIEKGEAKGVILEDGSFIAGKNVIINIPVQYIWEILEEKLFPEEYVKRAKNLVPTSGIAVDITLKKRVSKEKGLIYFDTPIAFGMFTSNIDPSIAPKGKQLLTFFYPTLLDDMKDQKKREEKRKEILDKIFSTWDIETNIEWKRVSYLEMVDGAQINIDQTRELRPGYSLPGMKNLFLVGDSVGAPGAGGDVGHESVHGLYRLLTGEEI